MAQDLENDIAQNATSPQSVTTRDGSVTSQNLTAQIEADRYLASKGMVSALHACRPVKMVPPSPIGSAIQGGP